MDCGIREIFACGIQNVGKFACGIRNPENFTCGIWTPGFWNPESHYQLESGIQKPSSTDKYWNPVIVIRNPQRGVQNPRLSWIPLTWGDTGAVKEWWQTAVLSQAVRKQLSQTVLMIGWKPLSFFQPPRPPLSVSQANFAVAAAPPALMTVKFVINTQIAPTGRMKPNAVSTKELGN